MRLIGARAAGFLTTSVEEFSQLKDVRNVLMLLELVEHGDATAITDGLGSGMCRTLVQTLNLSAIDALQNVLEKSGLAG